MNNGYIKAPKGSEFVKYLYDQCLLLDLRSLTWGDSGPRLLTQAIYKFNLQSSVLPPSVFNPIPHWSVDDFFNGKGHALNESSAVHLWNEMWRRNNYNSDETYSYDSLYEKLKRRYNLFNVFNDIYINNKWGSRESVSGHGSDLAETVVVRRELPELINSLNVQSLLDAPCGDYNWMSRTDISVKEYIGIDIVPALIENNKRLYGSHKCRFILGDVVHGALPKVDMILCRDCLVHLPLDQAMDAIKNFQKSDSTYLVATTYPNVMINSDKPAWSLNKDATRIFSVGDWRPLNLVLPPFNLGPPVLTINERGVGFDSEKTLGVWKLNTQKSSALSG